MNQRLQVLLFLLISWSTQVQAAIPPVLRHTTPSAAHLAATIRYVKEEASGAGTGTSWANASGDLQAMLRASVSGDQVWVARGTYKPTTGIDRTISFVLNNGVAVYGSFAGFEASPGQRLAASFPDGKPSSVLSGNIGGPGAADNTLHVLSALKAGTSTLLDGFIVSDGYIGSDDGFTAGSAMYNDGSSPTLISCSFQNNTVYVGGIMVNDNLSTPRLVNCVFRNNSSSSGGTILNQNTSTSFLTNCTLHNNDGFEIINFQKSSAILSNCVLFSTNRSFYGIDSATIALSYCLLKQGDKGFVDAGNNRFTVDSPFVSETDLRLNATARAIDGGNSNVNATPTDLAGKRRVVGSSIDMGAYEYQGVPVAISSQYQSVTNVCGMGQPGSFSVTVSGDGPFTATLFRDNTQLDQQTGTGTSFRFQQTSLQSGSYQIAITTTVNSVTTMMAPITVNPLPVQYSVVGSGAGCVDGIGTGIALSSSQVGVSYQLLRDNVAVGNPVDGTGSDYLSLGIQNVGGRYTVRATNKSTGCQQLMSGAAVYTTYPLPTQFALTGGGAYCAGGDGVLVGLSGSQTGIAYQLVQDGNYVGDFIEGTGQPLTFGRQTGAGTYTVWARDLNRGCQQDMTGSATVTVNKLVAITSQSQSITTVCVDNSAYFELGVNVSGTGPYTYTLFKDGVSSLQSATSPSDNVTFQAIDRKSGNYQIVITTACNSMTTTFAPVVVNPLPTPYAVMGGGATCAGSAGLVVGLSGSQLGVSYQLLRGTTPVGSAVVGTGAATTFPNQTTAGIYTVQATNATTSCQQTMTGSATVTINPKPVVTVTNPTAVCSPTTVDLTRTVVADVPVTFTFFTDAQLTQAVPNPAAVSMSGTYYVRALSGANCVADVKTVSVTVNPPPIVGISGLLNTYCQDAGIVPLGGIPSGGRFTVDGAVVSGLNTATLAVGNRTVVYSYTNANGCTNTVNQIVTIKATPPTPSLLTQQGGAYPGGQSAVTVDVNSGTVNLVVGGCAGTINWRGSNNTAGSNSSIPVATNTPGRVVYQATCTADGCTSPAASATVTVQGRLTVLLRDVDNYADNNAIQPLLVLQNQGASALPYSKLTLRYYLTVEGSAPLSNLSVNYAQVGNQNVRLRYVAPAQAGGQGYVEVGFTDGAGTLAAGASSGGIQSYFAKNDYSALNEQDDYSYAPVRNQLLATLRVTAYYDGVLIAGIEPGTTASIRAVRALTESKNGASATQINTFMEVRNEGNVPINYSDLKVRYYFTADGSERLQVEVDEGNVRAQLVKLATPLVNADTYLELSFTQGGQLAPGAGTGTIRYRISKPDGGRFNQANDYSYQEQPQERSQNSRVAVFAGNELIWGQLPGASARVAAREPGMELGVQVLGNPIVGSVLEADVTGVAGQSLTVQLTDVQGRTVARQQIEAAAATERIKLPVDQSSAGILLLQVSTPQQNRTLKVLRAQ